VDRGTVQHVDNIEGMRLLGLEEFEVPSEATPAEQSVIRDANKRLSSSYSLG
jgi:hypothetical protein